MRNDVIDASNAGLHQDGFIGGFYIRKMGPYAAGRECRGHAHYIDHPMNLVRGQVRIEWSNPTTGESGTVEVLLPCKILIKAEVHHKIIPLVDDTYWECWFSEAEAEKVYPDQTIPWHMEKPDNV